MLRVEEGAGVPMELVHGAPPQRVCLPIELHLSESASHREAQMKTQLDKILLRRLQLCRADIVATLADTFLPPSPQSIRMLSEIQLSIMAIEAAIRDKSEPTFQSEFLMEAAA